MTTKHTKKDLHFYVLGNAFGFFENKQEAFEHLNKRTRANLSIGDVNKVPLIKGHLGNFQNNSFRDRPRAYKKMFSIKSVDFNGIKYEDEEHIND